MTISEGVGSIGSAILVKVIADDFRECTPAAIQWLVARAVLRLPVDQRSRFAEEWAAVIDHTPGAVAKWLFAAGLQIGVIDDLRRSASAAIWRLVGNQLERIRARVRHFTTGAHKPEAIVTGAMVTAMIVACALEMKFPKWANRVDPDHVDATFGLQTVAVMMIFAVRVYEVMTEERKRLESLKS